MYPGFYFKLHVFLLTYCLIVLSCSKNDKTNGTDINPPLLEGKVQGSILLPTGSSINVNSLKVLSPIAETSVKDGKFLIDTVNFSSHIVQNTNGDPILMGYNYPGQQIHDISVQTTALAMLMNTPSILSLKKDFKLNIINNIVTDPSFNALAQEVEKLVLSGKSFTEIDSTNLSYSNAFAKLFSNIVVKRPADWDDEPILIHQAGKKVSFTNNATAAYHVVGIYLNGQFNKSYTIEGMKIFATSLWDLYNGVFEVGSNPGTNTHELSTDGDYTVKIRSGRPGFNDLSDEAVKALGLNLKSIIYDNIRELLPIEGSCLDQVKSNVESYIETVFDVKDINSDPGASELNKLASILLGITEKIIDNTADLFRACDRIKDPFPTNTFLKLTGKWFKWLSVIGTSANVTAHVYQWAMAKPASDTCFAVKGDKIIFCSDSIQYYKSMVPGNWITTYYYDSLYGTFHEEDKYVLFADGTGKRTSTCSAWDTDKRLCQDHTGSVDPDPYYNLVWTITGLNEGYIMSWWDKRWGQPTSGRITPALSFVSSIGSQGAFPGITRKE